MRIGRGIVGILIATAMMAGCNGEYEPQQETQKPVVVDFALTVSKSASPGSSGMTRMTAANMTGDAQKVNLLSAIPFQIDDTSKPIAVDDRYASDPITTFNKPRTTYAFFTSSCNFATGVNAVLAYGYPVYQSTPSYNENGKLNATFGDLQPANIHFELEPIKKQADYLAQGTANAIAAYLTTIANASIGEGEGVKTWKAYATNNANPDLKLLFKNFTNQLSGEVGEVLPGSAANVKAWVTELKKQLNGLTLSDDDADIRTAIITAIDAKLDNSNPQDWTETSWKDFPASIDLPDGAAVVRWDGTKFVPETQTTTVADINNLERITYPAEIYYYGNSPTMVSDQDLSDYFSTKSKWKKETDDDNGKYVLDESFTQGEVLATTKTVAMRDPLQYGVAQLVVKLKKTDSSLKDSKNADIPVGTDNFKLTGIIVGGQLPVGFNFKPESIYPSYTEADMSFIYDSQVNTNGDQGNAFFYLSSSADATKDIQTLVLHSYDGRSLKLVLEFESKVDFKGYNGYVYAGTKFYLVGEIVPEMKDAPKPYENRVFTQDYTTTIAVTVNSLTKAYNVLPNLLSPRLEMGIELTPQWEQATTTDVIL